MLIMAEEETVPHAVRNVVLSASTLSGDAVVNQQGEEVGRVEDVMIDLEYGRIAYVVLSYGRFAGADGKLLAIPWDALTPDPTGKRFVLDISRERLQNAPGFDKNHLPQMSDRKWGQGVHRFFGRRPYWEWHFK